MTRTFALIFAAAVSLTGCPGASRLVDAGPTPAAGVDAGPPQPPLILTARLTATDGGTTELTLPVEGRPQVEAPAQVTLTANLPLKNYRVRVFDDADRVVASDDVASNLPDHSTYDIHFVSPLRPGRRYALVLDAQTGAAFSDGLGRDHPDVRLEWVDLGERERSAKKAKLKKRKRK